MPKLVALSYPFRHVAEWDEQTSPAPPAKSLPKLPPRPGVGAAEEQTATEAPAPVDEPQLFFGSVDELLREKLRYTYARRVGPKRSN